MSSSTQKSRPSVKPGDTVIVEETFLDGVNSAGCATIGKSYEVIGYDEDGDITVKTDGHACTVTSWRLATPEASDPKVGETWAIRVEGEVTHRQPRRFILRDKLGHEFSFAPDDDRLEKVKDATPEWIEGDLVLRVHAGESPSTCRRNAKGLWDITYYTGSVGHDYPDRVVNGDETVTVHPLVKQGKPVVTGGS